MFDDTPSLSVERNTHTLSYYIHLCAASRYIKPAGWKPKCYSSLAFEPRCNSEQFGNGLSRANCAEAVGLL